MADTEIPKTYLITPSNPDLALFPSVLQGVLDDSEVACIRLTTAGMDETTIRRTADALRPITHDRDVPLVIDDHALLVVPLGLDGVHLTHDIRQLRTLRQELGDDVIIGASCGNSRHDGIGAAEAGADYVSFGPVGASPLGDGQQASLDLFTWWIEMIEIPVVAEGFLDEELLSTLSNCTDFIALGAEIWADDDPAGRLKQLTSCL